MDCSLEEKQLSLHSIASSCYWLVQYHSSKIHDCRSLLHCTSYGTDEAQPSKSIELLLLEPVNFPKLLNCKRKRKPYCCKVIYTCHVERPLWQALESYIWIALESYICIADPNKAAQSNAKQCTYIQLTFSTSKPIHTISLDGVKLCTWCCEKASCGYY